MSTERDKERGRQYYRDNCERLKAYTRAYKLEHRDDIKRKLQENRDVLRAKAKIYRHKNKDIIAAKQSAWLKENYSVRRTYALKKNFGITLEEYDAMLASQGYRCAICGVCKEDNPKWHTDHCHSSGKVRGILCHRCNLLLGHAKDRTDVLEKAIAYLKFSEV